MAARQTPTASIGLMAAQSPTPQAAWKSPAEGTSGSAATAASKAVVSRFPSGVLKAQLEGQLLQMTARASFDPAARNKGTAGAETTAKRPSFFSMSRRAATTFCEASDFRASIRSVILSPDRQHRLQLQMYQARLRQANRGP